MYIVNGDSKAYSAVVNSLPYGGDIVVKKDKCCTHITKRMGSGLRTLVKNYKGAYCILGYGFLLRINGLFSM